MTAKKIFLGLILGLLALQFIGVGLAKTLLPFFGVHMFVDNMAHLGYSRLGTFGVGLLDLLGGVGLLVPRLRGYAAGGLLLVLHGAIGAHIAAHDPAANIVGGAGLSAVLLTLVLVLDRPFIIRDRRTTAAGPAL